MRNSPGKHERVPSNEAFGAVYVEDVADELDREKGRIRLFRTLRSAFFSLLVAASLAVLVACLWLPVLRVSGTSMTPTLEDGEIVISVKSDKFDRGDIVGVYYGSSLLVKRCIATSGQWVDIDEEGNVSVDGELLDEPYLTEKAKGECDIDLPYQVPDETIFVMGDHRSTSIDSRTKNVGCIDMGNVAGRIVFRIWPLGSIGTI